MNTAAPLKIVPNSRWWSLTASEKESAMIFWLNIAWAVQRKSKAASQPRKPLNLQKWSTVKWILSTYLQPLTQKKPKLFTHTRPSFCHTASMSIMPQKSKSMWNHRLSPSVLSPILRWLNRFWPKDVQILSAWPVRWLRILTGLKKQDLDRAQISILVWDASIVWPACIPDSISSAPSIHGPDVNSVCATMYSLPKSRKMFSSSAAALAVWRQPSLLLPAATKSL